MDELLNFPEPQFLVCETGVVPRTPGAAQNQGSKEYELLTGGMFVQRVLYHGKVKGLRQAVSKHLLARCVGRCGHRRESV